MRVKRSGNARWKISTPPAPVSSGTATVGLAAETGLRAYEERTDARFSLTVQAGDATGWSAAAHRSIDRLHVQERTPTPLSRRSGGGRAARVTAGPVHGHPGTGGGRRTPQLDDLDVGRKIFLKGPARSAEKLGSRIIDRRLSLLNQPAHADLLGNGFAHEGLPVLESGWIEAGC